MSSVFISSTTPQSNLEEIKIVNKSNKTIAQIFLYDDDYNETMLLEEALEDGESISVKVKCGKFSTIIQDENEENCDLGEQNVCSKKEWIINGCTLDEDEEN